MAMDQAIKAQWVAALRSGEYKQQQGALHDKPLEPGQPERFCCLGVLCDLAYKAGAVSRQEGNERYSYGELLYGGILPPEVVQWAKLIDDQDLDGALDPLVALDVGYRTHNLTTLNDDKEWNFNQIADAIEGDPDL